MDFFGIGNTIKGMMEVYRRSSRATGRTTSLVESVKDGDTIIFSNHNEAERVKRICLDRGVDANCVFLNYKRPYDIFEKVNFSKGRTIFDHTWLEEFYSYKIGEAIELIDHLQKETSGYDEAHRETKRKAMEFWF